MSGGIVCSCTSNLDTAAQTSLQTDEGPRQPSTSCPVDSQPSTIRPGMRLELPLTYTREAELRVGAPRGLGSQPRALVLVLSQATSGVRISLTLTDGTREIALPISPSIFGSQPEQVFLLSAEPALSELSPDGATPESLTAILSVEPSRQQSGGTLISVQCLILDDLGN